ncbi:MAG: hypothetical protein GWN71_21725 [Gammaproteobacteria bacterium]|nr:hypothetical protein [Gemmatimonadota bacterium]NIR35062.1 hypothetical protein [Actinomycetota bacterium]NIU76088.1 hypothetical protein [Gammaproteobacteria bacterium]NIY09939.1 hypothetical protein [Gemmatimonadota bacterium]
MTGKQLRAVAARLEVVYPCLHPVRVKLTKALGPHLRDDGEPLGCTWGDTRVVKTKGQEILEIRVNVGLDPIARFMVFVHEYAHAMSWRPGHQIDADVFDHSPEWGLAEARLWVYFADELNEGQIVRAF